MANFNEETIMNEEVTDVVTCEPANNEVSADSGSSGISGKAIGMVAGGIALGVGAAVGIGKIAKKLGKKYLEKHGWVKVDPPVEKDKKEDEEEVIDFDLDELDIEDPGDDEEETEE